VQLGTLSDAIYFGVSDPQLSILPSGRLGVEQEGYAHAISQFRSASAVRTVKRWEEFGLAPVPESTTSRAGPPSPPDGLDDACRAEWSLTVSQMLEWASALLLNPDASFADVTVIREAEARARLFAAGYSEGIISKIFEFFCMHPDQIQARAQAGKMRPWRFNRPESYLQRPMLVRVDADGTEEFVIGFRRAIVSSRYKLDLVESGRLKAETEAMRRFVGGFGQHRRERFNDNVADSLEGECNTIVRRRVKKFGSVQMRDSLNRDIGDIDVLFIAIRERKMYVLETKDFEMARTPAELSREFEKLEHDTAHKHSKRMRWVSDRKRIVLESFGIPYDRRWRVEGGIIVSEDLIGVRYRDFSLPIWTLDNFMDRDKRGARTRQ
jgi:hypothetical protein